MLVLGGILEEMREGVLDVLGGQVNIPRWRVLAGVIVC